MDSGRVYSWDEEIEICWENIHITPTIGDELICYDPRYSFEENMERDRIKKYRIKMVEEYGFK